MVQEANWWHVTATFMAVYVAMKGLAGPAFTLCILAGALGNLVDRATLGYVVDFVFVHYDWFRFPVFNVADSAVTVGAGTWIALMALEALRVRRAAD